MTMELRSNLTGIPVLENGLSRKEMRHGEVPELTAAGLKQDPPVTAGGSRRLYTDEEFWDEYYPAFISHDWEDQPAFKEWSPMLYSEIDPDRVFLEYFQCRRCGSYRVRNWTKNHGSDDRWHSFCNSDKKIMGPITCNEAMMRRVLGG